MVKKDRIQVCLINNYHKKLSSNSSNKRRKEFEEVFRPFQPELLWEVIHHNEVIQPKEREKILSSDGIILSGSSYNLSEESVQKRFAPLTSLIRQYEKPILGICFGHQLLAHSFGFPIRPMQPEFFNSEWWERTHQAVLLQVRKGFPLLEKEKIWVELSHHEEIEESEEFHRVFEVFASTEACRIQMISHRQKPFFGVQFHPETGKDPRAREDGQKIFEGFIRMLRSK